MVTMMDIIHSHLQTMDQGGCRGWSHASLKVTFSFFPPLGTFIFIFFIFTCDFQMVFGRGFCCLHLYRRTFYNYNFFCLAGLDGVRLSRNKTTYLSFPISCELAGAGGLLLDRCWAMGCRVQGRGVWGYSLVYKFLHFPFRYGVFRC